MVADALRPLQAGAALVLAAVLGLVALVLAAVLRPVALVLVAGGLRELLRWGRPWRVTPTVHGPSFGGDRRQPHRGSTT